MRYILTTFALFLTLVTYSGEHQPDAGNRHEPYRPTFHFTPQTGWMNDPNGLVYLNGTYHLFYQYYPDGIVWGPMHWGHASSTDLMHWSHLPTALYPDSLGWIFSGSAVIDRENRAGFGKDAMVAIFTYHNDAIRKNGKKNTESQGIAYSLDEGKSWTKYSGNPVLKNSGEPDFRDPKVIWNEQINKWNMVLAVGDRIRIFSSSDLKQWQAESDFKPAENVETGVWECPDLFPMKTGNEEKWVLIVNHGSKAPNGGSGTRYFTGDFDGKKFTENGPARWLDLGVDFYAAVTYSNAPDSKRILIGWMSNWQYANKTPTSDYRSAMTLPRELILSKDHGSYFLRQKLVTQFYRTLKPVFSSKNIRMPFTKNGLDLSHSEITFTTLPDSESLTIVISNTLKEEFKIEVTSNLITMDRSKSGKTAFSDHFAQIQKIPIENSIRNLQLVLDRSSIEILLNDGKYSITNQVFPNEIFSILSIQTKSGKKITHLEINSVE